MPREMAIDVQAANKPRMLSELISAKYTGGGELDIPVARPEKFTTCQKMSEFSVDALMNTNNDIDFQKIIIISLTL